MQNREELKAPVRRGALRQWAGMTYYGVLRKVLWVKERRRFAKSLQKTPLPYLCFSHRTPLLRKLKDVDMWMQQNKVQNLTIAAARINNVVLLPGQVFSYWYLIGKPSKTKGYLPGMVLHNGTVQQGVGGGLCQLSNLIFWMTAHTPLTIIERHRHGYDVFPDSNRTQPFGSGATCFYPHGDLMIRNDTKDTWQLLVFLEDGYLKGQWRCTSPSLNCREVVEKNHRMQREYWGGYSRHNELYQQVFDEEGNLQQETLLVKNAAIMMYEPFLPQGAQ